MTFLGQFRQALQNGTHYDLICMEIPTGQSLRSIHRQKSISHEPKLRARKNIRS